MTPQADQPGDTLDPAFADYLLGRLVAALPAADDEAAELARRDAIRVAFLSMRPRNPMEAMIAAEAIAGHHVIMGCFRVALAPETEPAVAARARSNAATLSRVRLATLRALEKQQPPAPATVPATPARPKAAAVKRIEAGVAEPAQEQPPMEPPRYTPRDRFGKPIERWRWQEMTMAQRRAAYAEPGQVALWEEALAEEGATMAAQASADAIAPNPETGTQITQRLAAQC
jgi:hypothetical protein